MAGTVTRGGRARLDFDRSSGREGAVCGDQRLHLLRDILGDDLTAALLGVPVNALQALPDRETLPDDADARLTALVPLIDDLRGSYTDDGVRRWWDRPRSALDGRSPLETWARAQGQPSDEGVACLRALTGWLRGSGGAS
jgi:hypothetical protein